MLSFFGVGDNAGKVDGNKVGFALVELLDRLGDSLGGAILKQLLGSLVGILVRLVGLRRVSALGGLLELRTGCQEGGHVDEAVASGEQLIHGGRKLGRVLDVLLDEGLQLGESVGVGLVGRLGVGALAPHELRILDSLGRTVGSGGIEDEGLAGSLKVGGELLTLSIGEVVCVLQGLRNGGQRLAVRIPRALGVRGAIGDSAGNELGKLGVGIADHLVGHGVLQTGLQGGGSIGREGGSFTSAASAAEIAFSRAARLEAVQVAVSAFLASASAVFSLEIASEFAPAALPSR